MVTEDFPDSCARSICAGEAAGVLLLRAGVDDYRGTSVHVGGAELRNFGSCSYLGLEVREELKQGVIDAVRRYGTQYPFAKPQLECALYRELEASLERMTGGRAIVASSATLAHLAAVPALMSPKDAVVMDRLAHASLYAATLQLKNVPLEIVPHNRIDVLEERVAELSATRERVWYIMDGIYSMSGDFAPIRAIAELLTRYPNLYLYSDDAHSTSWLGERGRGFTLQEIPAAERARVVVTLSLNKAFSAGGGALILPTEELRDRVRHAGAAMMFSGPIQPPMLGAAVASARLHLAPEFVELQQRLHRRIRRLHELADECGIRLGVPDPTPIAFVPCGRDESMFALFHAMRGHGFYLAPAVFPAVGVNRAGLRLTVSLHNSEEDSARLMETMSAEMKKLPDVVAYQRGLAS